MGNWFGRARQRLKKNFGRQVDYVKKGAKSVGRTAAPVIAKAAPYFTGASAAVVSFFATPAAGALVAGAGGELSRYWGSTAARSDGIKGHGAREEGRDLRKKSLIFGGGGVVAGTAAALAVGSPWVSSIFGKAAAPTVTATATQKTASSAAIAAEIGRSVGAATGATVGSAGAGASVGATVGAAVGAASGGAAGAAAATAAGGGILGTVGTVLDAAAKAAGIAAPFLPNLIPQKPPSDLGELLDFAAGLAGGGGAAGAPPEDLSDAYSGKKSVPGWVYLAGGAAVLGAGYLAVKAMKKAA